MGLSAIIDGVAIGYGLCAIGFSARLKSVATTGVLICWIAHAVFIILRMLAAPQLQPPWIGSYDAAIFFSCAIVGIGFISAVRYEVPIISPVATLIGLVGLLWGRALPSKGFEPILLRFDSLYFSGFSFSFGIAMVLLTLASAAFVFMFVSRLFHLSEPDLFDVCIYKLTSNGFILLSAALILRGFWMYRLEGRYWVWDSLTYVHLLVWFSVLLFLHAKRIRHGR